MSLSPLIQERRRRLADFIEQPTVEDLCFNIQYFCCPRRDCGTSACVAGHSAIMRNAIMRKHTTQTGRQHSPNHPAFLEEADFLGLTTEQKEDLFFPFLVVTSSDMLEEKPTPERRKRCGAFDANFRVLEDSSGASYYTAAKAARILRELSLGIEHVDWRE